jgi:hypothetical protein
VGQVWAKNLLAVIVAALILPVVGTANARPATPVERQGYDLAVHRLKRLTEHLGEARGLQLRACGSESSSSGATGTSPSKVLRIAHAAEVMRIGNYTRVSSHDLAGRWPILHTSVLRSRPAMHAVVLGTQSVTRWSGARGSGPVVNPHLRHA